MLPFSSLFELAKPGLQTPWFEGLANLLTITLLSLSFFVTIRALRLNAQANELQLLPIPIIVYRHDNKGVKRFVMKNIGNGPAFMIRVVFNEVFFMDTQRRWKIELNLPRLRSLEKGEKRIMEINLFENGVQKEISDFTATAIRSLRLENTVYFTNAMSEGYYIKITTGYDMIEFDPPVKLNIINKSILFFEQHTWPIRIRVQHWYVKKTKKPHWEFSKK